jgi:hypothetical protein
MVHTLLEDFLHNIPCTHSPKKLLNTVPLNFRSLVSSIVEQFQISPNQFKHLYTNSLVEFRHLTNKNAEDAVFQVHFARSSLCVKFLRKRRSKKEKGEELWSR